MKWWRRKPKHPPREGWVVLLDAWGREASERKPVVVFGDPLAFKVDHDLSFTEIERATVRSVRVIDADGHARDVPL